MIEFFLALVAVYTIAWLLKGTLPSNFSRSGW
jgi:hypothetical protein